jgi:hypothetical protein
MCGFSCFWSGKISGSLFAKDALSPSSYLLTARWICRRLMDAQILSVTSLKALPGIFSAMSEFLIYAQTYPFTSQSLSALPFLTCTPWVVGRGSSLAATWTTESSWYTATGTADQLPTSPPEIEFHYKTLAQTWLKKTVPKTTSTQ